MADSESAALTGLGDTPALGAVGETRTLMALTTATSRLRVYQFRHDRLHSKKTIVFPESFLHSREKIPEPAARPRILTRNLVGLQVILRSRRFGAGCSGSLRRLFGRHRTEHASLTLLILLVESTRAEGDSNGGAEEDRRSHSRGARQEVGRAGGAKERTGSARTESRAEIGALAVLQEHQNNDGNRSNDLHNDRDTHQHLHSCVFSVMVLILVVKKLSICLRLSAPCRSRKNPVP